MPKNTRPNPDVRKGLPMSSLDWELLAVLDEVDPVQAGLIISALADLKVAGHVMRVHDRRWWEFHNPTKIRGGFAAPLDGEPFVGERYDT